MQPAIENSQGKTRSPSSYPRANPIYEAISRSFLCESERDAADDRTESVHRQRRRFEWLTEAGLSRYLPLFIPIAATPNAFEWRSRTDLAPTKAGYLQVQYEATRYDVTYRARWHTKVSHSKTMLGVLPNWVVERVTSGGGKQGENSAVLINDALCTTHALTVLREMPLDPNIPKEIEGAIRTNRVVIEEDGLMWLDKRVKEFLDGAVRRTTRGEAELGLDSLTTPSRPDPWETWATIAGEELLPALHFPFAPRTVCFRLIDLVHTKGFSHGSLYRHPRPTAFLEGIAKPLVRTNVSDETGTAALADALRQWIARFEHTDKHSRRRFLTLVNEASTQLGVELALRCFDDGVLAGPSRDILWKASATEHARNRVRALWVLGGIAGIAGGAALSQALLPAPREPELVASSRTTPFSVTIPLEARGQRTLLQTDVNVCLRDASGVLQAIGSEIEAYELTPSAELSVTHQPFFTLLPRHPDSLAPPHGFGDFVHDVLPYPDGWNIELRLLLSDPLLRARIREEMGRGIDVESHPLSSVVSQLRVGEETISAATRRVGYSAKEDLLSIWFFVDESMRERFEIGLASGSFELSLTPILNGLNAELHRVTIHPLSRESDALFSLPSVAEPRHLNPWLEANAVLELLSFVVPVVARYSGEDYSTVQEQVSQLRTELEGRIGAPLYTFLDGTAKRSLYIEWSNQADAFAGQDAQRLTETIRELTRLRDKLGEGLEHARRHSRASIESPSSLSTAERDLAMFDEAVLHLEARRRGLFND